MAEVRPHAPAADERDELVFPASGMCFGCSSANPAGLGLRFFRDEPGIVCEATIGAAHQGALDIVHGGIQAVLLDEASCAAAFFTAGTYVVTGSLGIRYRKPCPIAQPLKVHARVVRDEGRFLVIAAEIRGASGDLFTSAEGKFYRDARRSRA